MGKKKDFILLMNIANEKYKQYSYSGDNLRRNYSARDYTASLGLAHEPNNIYWFGINSGIKANLIKPVGVDINELQHYRRLNYFAEGFIEFNSLDAPIFANSGWLLRTNIGLNVKLDQVTAQGDNLTENIAEDKNYVNIEAQAQRNQKIYLVSAHRSTLGQDGNQRTLSWTITASEVWSREN